MKTHIALFIMIAFTVWNSHSLAQQQRDTTAAVEAGPVPRDPGFAQIKVIAQASTDSVVLRWAPSTPHGWRVANRTGYMIERRSGSGQFVRITPDTIHSWLPDRLIREVNERPDHPYMGLALNALWGDSTLLSAPDGSDTLGVLAERNMNLFSYALFAADNDPLIAEALGLRYVDRNVKVGDRFTYRISLNVPTEYKIDSGEVVVDVKNAVLGPPPVNLSAKGLDRRIEIRWEAQQQNDYSGYHVYRSDDNGRTFRKLTNRPMVLLISQESGQAGIGVFTDTTIVNYKLYKYQVKGINAFGEFGTAGQVEAMGRDMTPPFPPLVKNPEQVGKTKVKLSWDVPEVDADLAGFIISRSAISDSNFRSITPKRLPKAARTFTDTAASDEEPFYVVSSVDTAGNQSPSLPMYGILIDTMPPAIPKGLSGTIDTAGVVRLLWRKNAERNLLGYRVLRANAPDHEFTQLTGQVWHDTLFTDTVEVNTLTRFIYYKIAAVNNRYNHSEMTPVLALKRPDMVPPDAPVFTNVQATDSSVMLKWAASTSEDVKSHVLYRRTDETQSWTMLATLSRIDAMYVDKAVTQNVMYEYEIEAVDSSGLKAMAELPVQGRPYDTGVRPTVSGLRGSYDAAQKKVVLNWLYKPVKQEKFFYLIYRSALNTPLNHYKSIQQTQSTFADDALLGNGMYTYAVKVITDSGAESPLSERVQVTVSDK
jgi:fibronectin type 3 domain-containing protein